MTFREYTSRVSDCFEWQWRWGVFLNDLRDKRNATGNCCWMIGVGVMGVFFLAITPVVIPATLIWKFCVQPFTVAFRLSREQAENLKNTLASKNEEGGEA